MSPTAKTPGALVRIAESVTTPPSTSRPAPSASPRARLDARPEEDGAGRDLLAAFHPDGVAAAPALYAFEGRAEAQVHAVAFEPAPDASADLFAEALPLRDLLQAHERHARPPAARGRPRPRTL